MALAILGDSLERGCAALLPQDCVLCGSRSKTLLCAPCASELPRLPAALCPVCALPAPGGKVCGSCQTQPPSFDATLAAFRYGFPLDRLVQALKYQHRLALAAWFARAMLAGPRPTADCVVALPLSTQRLRLRGFNQAVEVARPVARALGLPLHLTACSRHTDTVAQASLPWRARQSNVRGVFDVARDLSGCAVLVVDDVMTSGASLNEFARALKKSGALRVSNWVVARALRTP